MKAETKVKMLTAAVLLSMMVLFSGCPYYSDVPVDDGSVKIPEMMTGKWKKSEDGSAKPSNYYVIEKTDDYHASLKAMELSTSDSSYKESLFEITLSDVDGELFMNAFDTELGGFFIYKIELDKEAGEITVYEVTEFIREEFENSSELKEFIAEGKSYSYFFSNTVDTFIRM